MPNKPSAAEAAIRLAGTAAATLLLALLLPLPVVALMLVASLVVGDMDWISSVADWLLHNDAVFMWMSCAWIVTLGAEWLRIREQQRQRLTRETESA